MAVLPNDRCARLLGIYMRARVFPTLLLLLLVVGAGVGFYSAKDRTDHQAPEDTRISTTDLIIENFEIDCAHGTHSCRYILEVTNNSLVVATDLRITTSLQECTNAGGRQTCVTLWKDELTFAEAIPPSKTKRLSSVNRVGNRDAILKMNFWTYTVDSINSLR